MSKPRPWPTLTALSAVASLIALTACAPETPSTEPVPSEVTVQCSTDGDGNRPQTLTIARTERPDFASVWDSMPAPHCETTSMTGARSATDRDVAALGWKEPLTDDELARVYAQCASRARVPPDPPPHDLSTTERLQAVREISQMLALCPDHPHTTTLLMHADKLGDF